MTTNEAEGSVPTWVVHVDGSSTSHGSGAGVLLESPQGDKLMYSIKFQFPASNNELEYEALVAGIKLALSAGARSLVVHSDSQLVVNQLNGTYEAKEEKMNQYVTRVNELLALLESYEIKQLPRAKNQMADRLAKIASSWTNIDNRTITFLTINKEEAEKAGCNIFCIKGEEPSWKEEIVNYLMRDDLPQDPAAELGNRPGGTFPPSYGTEKIYHSCRRIFHEVGRGRAIVENFGERRHRFPVENRSVQVWDSPSTDLGQRRSVLWSKTKGVVSGSLYQTTTSVGKLQANGQTEVTNRTILQHLKTCLGNAKKNWVEELPSALWAYRTTPCMSTGESHFNLAYDVEAIAPAEIGETSLRVKQYKHLENDQALAWLRFTMIESRGVGPNG
ncbi:uncharacterized protein LOC142524025 [Primulina tabacum]|uniref:uncharacterized protein LOC142524025 n=1 Tax=Primulina tabacum TaxID=48773 RepID=UPI003F5A9B99